MQEETDPALKAGPLTLSVLSPSEEGQGFRVRHFGGREDGKPVLPHGRRPTLPNRARAGSWLKAKTPARPWSPNALGGAPACAAIMTKGTSGKWQTIKAGAIDGDYGPLFEDLDGDGRSRSSAASITASSTSSTPARPRHAAKIEADRRQDRRRDAQPVIAAIVQCLAAIGPPTEARSGPRRLPLPKW